MFVLLVCSEEGEEEPKNMVAEEFGGREEGIGDRVLVDGGVPPEGTFDESFIG